MAWWLAFALQAVPPGPDAATFDLARAAPADLAATRRCADASASGDVVVCGSRRDRYRLPLPAERSPAQRIPGEAPTGSAVLTSPGGCGIFEGERRCDKAEAAAYGYGNGRDPVTVLTRFATRLVDPDAD